MALFNTVLNAAPGGRNDTDVPWDINEVEAAVVRDIFKLCAEGVGQVRITRQLNAAGQPAPRSQQGRPRAWAPSSVHEVLFRSLYRGVIMWNRSRKRNQWGQHQQTARPEAEWLQVLAPAPMPRRHHPRHLAPVG